MSPKILEEKREEKDGIVKIRRVVKDEILGEITLVLTITPQEISLRKWYSRHYGETRLTRVKLLKPYKGIDTIIEYVHGFEGEGNNWWRGVDIVPFDPSHVNMLMSKVKDFDTFSQVISCLYDKCKGISTHNVVECDISACL
jgi:hypothetical protein